jgi:cellulose synthase/poly-beta-1,6-N-acetylglucosamine synthase-like glycosyltransferase
MELFITSCSLAYWIAMVVLTIRVCARVPDLRGSSAPLPKSWPKVSLIVAARNEANTLAPALRSKLEHPYPNLEVVLVDDRSNDATSSLARRMAVEYPGLRVIRVDALPKGWLGKVHAMQRGLEQASGQWLLFCDADVHLEAHTLRRVIAYAEHERVDHVAMLPGITARQPTLVWTLATFLRQLCVGGRLGDVANPRSSASVGIGAFNLVRRCALARTPGLEQLRMEIDDDVALGRMLHHFGAEQRLVNGCTGVRLEFVPSFHALTRSLEKNGANATFPVVLVGLAGLIVLEGGLLVGLFSGAALAIALAVVAWLCASAATLRITRWLNLPSWPAVLPFVGMLPLAWALGRSSALAAWRGGVMWRGTFYSKAALRTAARVRDDMAASDRTSP